MLVGFSNTQAPFGPLPFDLSGLGMTGCRLRVSGDLLLGVDAATGEAKLPLDKDPGLPGVRLHLQAVILEPGANPFGAVLSDAVTAVVGN